MNLGRVFCLHLIQIEEISIPYQRRIMYIPPSLYLLIYWTEALVIKFCQLTLL